VANKDDENSSDDSSLFRDAVKGVKRLEQGKRAPRTKPPAPMPAQSRLDSEQALIEMANGTFDFEELEYGDEVQFQRPGVTRNVMRRLRRGQYAVQAELDLHGLAVAEAKSELADFVRSSALRGLGCVRVIHGKGHRSPGKTPVLKPKVSSWLSNWDDVIAFTTARPVDGGTGALYVLLKHR